MSILDCGYRKLFPVVQEAVQHKMKQRVAGLEGEKKNSEYMMSNFNHVTYLIEKV